jgi:nucleotide-binding universal stress UspA family protein
MRILIPWDGSDCSKQAIPVATHLALASQGSIYVLHVFTASHTDAERAQRDLRDQYLEEARSHIDHFDELVKQKKVKINFEVIANEPHEGILEFTRAAEFDPEDPEKIIGGLIDLVVMSSHGRSGFRQRVLGSVTEKVANHSRVPVFVLRCTQLHSAKLPHPIRALISLDGSPLAEKAIEPAAKLVKALVSPIETGAPSLKGSLHLASVPVGVFDSMAARTYLEEVRKHFQEKLIADDLSITSSIVENKEVAAGLLEMAEEGNYGQILTGEALTGGCDLIAMSTHGIGGRDRWTMGSITDSVLYKTNLPMLIVRPDPPQIPKEVEIDAESSWPPRS